MENTVFPLPEVSGLLNKTVEARLHLDKTKSEFYSRMVEVRDEFAGVATAPVYILLDPETLEVLGRQEGASSKASFRGWLQKSMGARS